ncbi:hypothetical protein Tco_1391338 [Tanacetum coccineum]
MESISAQVVAAAKLPMLNPNELELWKMRIEQYFLMTDYALWEVIVNGDSPPPKRTIDGVEQTYPSTTAEEKLVRKNELKAKERNSGKIFFFTAFCLSFFIAFCLRLFTTFCLQQIEICLRLFTAFCLQQIEICLRLFTAFCLQQIEICLRLFTAFCLQQTAICLSSSLRFVLSYDESKSRRVSERAFMTLFGQDNETFTSTMFLYVDQLQNQLNKDEFQEDKSMAAFWVLNNQFQKFIDCANMNTSKRHRTKSDEHITSSSLGTYITHVVDADIRLVNGQVLSSEVDSNTTHDSTNMCHRGGEIDQDAEQYKVKSPLLNAEFVKSKEMIEKETYNELSRGVAKLLAANEQLQKENEHLKQTYKELYDSIKKTRVQNKDNSDSLISQINQKSVENADLKAQIQEKVFANAALKNELRKLKGIAWILRHNFSPKKDFRCDMTEKTSPRSCLRWKPTGKIFTAVGLKWIPKGKLFDSCTGKVDSEHPNGSNDVITNPYECDQTLNVSASTLNLSAVQALDLNVIKMASANNTLCPALQRKERCTHHTGPAPTFLTLGQISSGLVPNSVLAAPYVPPTNKELEILFQPMFDEYMEPPHVERPVSPAPAVSVPVNSAGTPSSTTIDQDAPSPSHSPSSSAFQSPSLHKGIAADSTLMEDNPFAPVDNHPFINVFAPEPSSEASSSGDLSSAESPYVLRIVVQQNPFINVFAPVSQTLHHLGK